MHHRPSNHRSGDEYPPGPGVRALVETFGHAGIAVPPIPGSLAPEFEEVSKRCFSSREIRPMDAYRFTPYLTEICSSEVPDYVAVVHAGHGVNSYALTYLVVLDPVAIMAQTLYGGIYTDNARALQKWATLMDDCLELLSLVSSLSRSSLGGRLVVAESRFRTVSGWDLIADGSESDWARRQVSNEPIRAATAWLEARQSAGPQDFSQGPSKRDET